MPFSSQHRSRRVRFSDEVTEIPVPVPAPAAARYTQPSVSSSHLPDNYLEAAKPLACHPYPHARSTAPLPSQPAQISTSGILRRDVSPRSARRAAQIPTGSVCVDYMGPPGEGGILWTAIKELDPARKKRTTGKAPTLYGVSNDSRQKGELGTPALRRHIKAVWSDIVVTYKKSLPSSSALFYQSCRQVYEKLMGEKKASQKRMISRPIAESFSFSYYPDVDKHNPFQARENFLDVDPLVRLGPRRTSNIPTGHRAGTPEAAQPSFTFRLSPLKLGAIRVADFPATVRETWQQKVERSSKVSTESDDTFYCKGLPSSPHDKGRPAISPRRLRQRNLDGNLPSEQCSETAHAQIKGNQVYPADLAELNKGISVLHKQGQSGQLQSSAAVPQTNQGEVLMERELASKQASGGYGSSRRDMIARVPPMKIDRSGASSTAMGGLCRDSTFYRFWDDILRSPGIQNRPVNVSGFE